MKSIQAIFRNGAGPVELPEASRVEIEPRLVSDAKETPSLDEVYAVLNRRFHSGEGDIAEKHNEHQP